MKPLGIDPISLKLQNPFMRFSPENLQGWSNPIFLYVPSQLCTILNTNWVLHSLTSNELWMTPKDGWTFFSMDSIMKQFQSRRWIWWTKFLRVSEPLFPVSPSWLIIQQRLLPEIWTRRWLCMWNCWLLPVVIWPLGLWVHHSFIPQSKANQYIARSQADHQTGGMKRREWIDMKTLSK